jgi:hypothetical protein
VLGVFGARGGIDAVGADHQVVFPGIVVRILELGFKFQIDAKFPSPRLEDLQQFQAPDAAIAVSTGDDATALEEHVAVVPVMEIALDLGDDLRVILAEAVHGLVGEHDAPAEGAVGLVALDDGDFAGRIGLLHQDREIESGGAASENCCAHVLLLFAGLGVVIIGDRPQSITDRIRPCIQYLF